MGIIDILKTGSTTYGAIGVGLLLIATHGTTAYYAYDAGKDSVKTEAYESQIDAMSNKIIEIISQNERYQDSVNALNARLGTANVTAKEIIKTVEKEVEKPVYKNCSLPPSGVRTLRESIDRYNAKRVSGGASSEVLTDTAH